MLSKDGTMARFIFAFCLFFLSGSGMVEGWWATCCGVLGTVELATGLCHYSPLNEWLSLRNPGKDPSPGPQKKG